jgi:hypothetical protein
MKLSEAIMLGSLTTRPMKSLLIAGDAACALGAAAVAIGRPSYIGVEHAFPWIDGGDRFDCPACGPRGIDLRSSAEVIIVHLNDCHDWTRERIADWVASIEPAEAVSTQSEGRETVCTEPAEMD